MDGGDESKAQYADDGPSEHKEAFIEQEKQGFLRWINKQLQNDRYLTKNHFKKYLPIDEDGEDFFEKVKDGIMLCKLINNSKPGTVDERALNYPKTRPLNYFMMLENQSLALNSCIAIGCRIVNIRPENMVDGIKEAHLNVVWQVIRVGLMENINFKYQPGLKHLLNIEDGETAGKLMAKTPEDILVRWTNWQLKRVCTHKQIKNFYKDIQDGEAYTYLFTAIDPQNTDLLPLRESDPEDRMEMLLEYAGNLGIQDFLTSPQDIISGNIKLNTAFIAHLFNTFPTLEYEDQEDCLYDFDDIIEKAESVMFFEESREEKSFRHWINSLNLSSWVSSLYEDLRDGHILIQVLEVLREGLVHEEEVNVPPFKENQHVYKSVENCNYCITLGNQLGFKLVGIEGMNIYEGSKLLLSLLQQMMRYYTLSLMKNGEKELTEEEVIKWCNNKLRNDKNKHGRSVFTSFRDPTLTTSHALLDLIDIIQPGSIGDDIVCSGSTAEEKIDNARYCLTMARKIGATVFALPEDIVEGNHKMLALVFARLMNVGTERGN